MSARAKGRAVRAHDGSGAPDRRASLSGLAGCAGALAALAALALAAPSSSGAVGPRSEADAPRSQHAVVTRRWYRISATVVATLVSRDETDGVTLRRTRSAWTTSSNTAVVVFRQCAVRGGLSGRELALVFGAGGESCAAVRAAIRATRGRAQARTLIRRLREDVRFTAAGGTLWNLYLDQETLAGVTAGAADGSLVECPPWGPTQRAAVSGLRTSGGRIATASLVSEGVAASPGVRPVSVGTRFSRPEYPGCFDPNTGAQLRSGAAAAYDYPLSTRQMAAGPALLTASSRLRNPFFARRLPKRSSVAGLFGRSFSLTDAHTRRETTGAGRYRTTVTIRHTVRLRVCPRGGRDVRRC